MTIDDRTLRLDGVYRMNNADDLMLRVKVPAGVLSAPQADAVCAVAEAFAHGRLHLTCRGSIELHRLRHEHLGEIFRRLAAVGLTGRGACGGAVRGISCSTSAGPGFAVAQRVARQLHRHFAGNPHFEGLPKKFKIGVESGYAGARHLIQDLGIVHSGSMADGERFDLWCGGGLGREPQAAILLRREVGEAELLPLAEAVIRVYGRHAPPGKRLKHVVRVLGEERLRELVEAAFVPARQPQQSLAGALTADTGVRLTIPVFAGEIAAGDLRRIAAAAGAHGDGMLVLTADQDLVLFFPAEAALAAARAALAGHGLLLSAAGLPAAFRVCPGSHECRMGLAPTRDVAREVIAVLGEHGRTLAWAISGCPNSCSQPQLADVGIISGKLVRNEDGSRAPRFDLSRREGEGLGEVRATGLDLESLLGEIAGLG